MFISLKSKIIVPVIVVMIMLVVFNVVYVAISTYHLAGMFAEAGFDYAYALELTRNLQRNLVIIGAIVLTITAFAMRFLIFKLLKPLDILAENAHEVAEGNISVNFAADRKDEIGRVSRSFKEIVDTLTLLQKDFTLIETNVEHGKIHYRNNDASLHGVFREIMDKMNFVVGDYEHSIDLISESVVCIDGNKNISHTNQSVRKLTGNENLSWDQIVGMSVDDFLGGNIANHPATVQAFKDGLPQLEVVVQLEVTPGQLLDFEYNCMPYQINGIYAGAMLLLTNISHITKAQRLSEKRGTYRNKRNKNFISSVVTGIEEGNLGFSIPHIDHDDDTKDIAATQDSSDEAIQNAMRTIKGYVDEITAVLQDIAGKNLAVGIDRPYEGDFLSIKDSINLITQSISTVIHDIQMASGAVQSGSELIAGSTQVMMASFEEQSAAMAEVTEAVKVLTEKTQKNTADAKSANTLSEQVHDAAETGTQHMKDMSEAMDEIKQSSEEIAKVASIIEGIAFQTNLLALNASVEAARAGEHGKGFSVVADEVRSLAARSAEAARDTSDMLAKSINRVNLGVEKSAQTAEALQEIVNITSGVTEVISGIAAASDEQAEEISKIQNSVEAIYRGSTENANLVQDNASVSEELAGQAAMLNDMVEQFKIGK